MAQKVTGYIKLQIEAGKMQNVNYNSNIGLSSIMK